MRVFVALLMALLAVPAQAEIDLARAGVTVLDNGLTVIVLEERSLPVVSVQVVYRSGSRDETSGKTGLAHMLEHLAFRASENFPDGAATDAVYDAGGEWHGYTWLDQATYYSTMPADGLDLLLAIEADRMARVVIDPAAMAAEIGAVITEMRGYQNDPSSVLFDAVTAAALVTHPYRGNTIGYESDVRALTAEDARAFYEAHYAPGNAVLAIVGDVDAAAALALVSRHFASLPAREVAARVNAVEPPQSGERRFRLYGAIDRNYLRIAFPAPAFTSADFPAYLLMQQLLSGGSGVNFRQNDWGTPAVEGSALYGMADDMASWVIPTADPYLLMLSASVEGGPSQRYQLENALIREIMRFSRTHPDNAALDAARAAVREALVYDLETPEDAAHQLAFFAGLRGLDALTGLGAALERVTPDDVARVAATYLEPSRATVGWYQPGPVSPPLDGAFGLPRSSAERTSDQAPQAASSAAQVNYLSNGLPVIVRQIGLSPTVSIVAITNGGGSGGGFARAYGMALVEGLSSDLPQLARAIGPAIADSVMDPASMRGIDPAIWLETMLIARRVTASGDAMAPVVVAISGAFNQAEALAALEQELGSLTLAPPPEAVATQVDDQPIRTISSRNPWPVAQAALGYTVRAPSPGSIEGLAMRMTLYILTHEYGGRLGDAAIKDTGLVYYIGSDYAGDAVGGQVELSMGVDPDKIDQAEALLRAEILRLASEPPTAPELNAARSHILGREISAAMDNSEIAGQLARQWLATGALPDNALLAEQLATIGPDEIALAARQIAAGTILRVDVGPAPVGEIP